MLSVMVCLAVLRGPVIDTGGPVMMPAARLLALLEARKPCQVHCLGDPAIETLPVLFHASPENCTPDLLVMVLKANGFHVGLRRFNDGAWHMVVSRIALASAQADRNGVPHVHVYVPRRMTPEKLMRLLEGASFAGKVKGYTSPGGRIILRAGQREDLDAVLALFQKADKPRRQMRGYHVFQCEGMMVDRVHTEVLRLLDRDTLGRIRFVAHENTNTLLVACGSDDWTQVLKNLAFINPGGKEL